MCVRVYDTYLYVCSNVCMRCAFAYMCLRFNLSVCDRKTHIHMCLHMRDMTRLDDMFDFTLQINARFITEM